jgi:hypothetical protein
MSVGAMMSAIPNFFSFFFFLGLRKVLFCEARAAGEILHGYSAPEALWFTHRATTRYDVCPLAGFGGLNNIFYCIIRHFASSQSSIKKDEERKRR